MMKRVFLKKKSSCCYKMRTGTSRGLFSGVQEPSACLGAFPHPCCVKLHTEDFFPIQWDYFSTSPHAQALLPHKKRSLRPDVSLERRVLPSSLSNTVFMGILFTLQTVKKKNKNLLKLNSSADQNGSSDCTWHPNHCQPHQKFPFQDMPVREDRIQNYNNKPGTKPLNTQTVRS